MASTSANLKAVKCLRFSKFGAASEVLHMDQVDLGPWDGKSALVRWLASPINPIDLYIIKGNFDAKLPAIGGVEGVGVVEKVGTNKKWDIEMGDRVIKVLNDICLADGGIWTQYSYIRPEVLVKIHPDIGLVSAATLGVNPPTAYALLQAVLPLKRGDCVIQNAANSGVGRVIIQLAKHFGYQTINLIRQHDEAEEMARLEQQLRTLGADWVFTEPVFADMLSSHEHARSGTLPTPRLALDQVGGESTFLVSAALDQANGMLVMFGSISGTPPRISPELRKEPRNFSISDFCSKKKNAQKVKEMFAELQQLILQGKLRPPPAELRPLKDYRVALQNAISHGTKQILLLNEAEQKLE